MRCLKPCPLHGFQKYFNNWNFTSPHTIRVEAGLSTMMEQYDRNVKIQRLIGTDGVHKKRKQHGDNSSNQQLLSGGSSNSRDSSGNNSETDEIGYLEPRPTRNAERVSRSTANRATTAAAAAALKGGTTSDSSCNPIDANKKVGTMLNPFLR